MGDIIEEYDLIQGKYVLEVSSPGVGQPLKLKRQYHKNVGRHLDVLTLEGKEYKGKLIDVLPNAIILKFKKKPEDSIVIEFDNIKTAKISISFK